MCQHGCRELSSGLPDLRAELDTKGDHVRLSLCKAAAWSSWKWVCWTRKALMNLMSFKRAALSTSLVLLANGTVVLCKHFNTAKLSCSEPFATHVAELRGLALHYILSNCKKMHLGKGMASLVMINLFCCTKNLHEYLYCNRHWASPNSCNLLQTFNKIVQIASSVPLVFLRECTEIQ